ncbi:MAG: Smr/MutS family protein [Proteobacteria bacterium]|nr:Smr/MutS family protein [Pseudomonadota bacterium]
MSEDPDQATPWATDPEEPVVVPIENWIDLHTFRPDEVSRVLDAYLEAAREKGLPEVRIVHGKGRGVLKAGVLAFLDRSAHVSAHSPAPEDRGGWGATLVRLRPGPPAGAS